MTEHLNHISHLINKNTMSCIPHMNNFDIYNNDSSDTSNIESCDIICKTRKIHQAIHR